MRYALYFTPEAGTELATLGDTWLGRSAATGKTIEQPDFSGLPGSDLARFTGPARRYGFHGTLKAPFRLREDASEAALVDAVRSFASDMPAFDIPALKVDLLEGFLALTPDGPADELNSFANRVVEHFEPFRDELSEREIERRNPDRLSSAELKNMLRWGYPYVFDLFRFHMTLSTRLPEADAPRVMSAATQYFAPVLDGSVPVRTLALFVEPEPGAPFRIHSRLPLASAQQHRKTA
jgi:putative phosphonate metabolism protein